MLIVAKKRHMTTYDTSMNEAAMCGASNILHALHTCTSNEEKTIKIEMSNVFLCVYTFQIAGIAYTHFMHIELKRTNDNTFRIDLGYFPLGYWNFTFQIIYIMFVTLEFRERKKYKNLLRVFVAMPNRNLSTHSSFLSKQ